MILQVAIPKPLYCHFDYLPPLGKEINHLSPGIRIRVPFGKTLTCVGLLLGLTEQSAIPRQKLKTRFRNFRY